MTNNAYKLEFRKMNYITLTVHANAETGEICAVGFRRNRTLKEQRSADYMQVFNGKTTTVFIIGKGAYVEREMLMDMAIRAVGDPSYVTTFIERMGV